MKNPFPALVVIAVAVAGCAGEPDGVRLEDPWILEAPGGTDSMAGYGVLRNGTEDTVTVERVDSPVFGRVHVHETRVEDGQARMTPVDSLTLPAGGRAVMRPGGLHLMVMAPGRELEYGDSAEIRFHLSNGETLVADFPVRRQPPEDS